MDSLIIAEVLDKSGKVHERHKLAHFPATLGRAYDCDLILNDEFVSPHHARLSINENNVLSLTDLGSENGTYCLPQLQALTTHELGAESLLRLGHSIVRLRHPDFALAPTRIDTLTHSRLAHFFSSTAMLWVCGLLLLSLLGLNSYQSSAQAKTLGLLLLENIEIVALVPLWAGIWALLSRIFVHHAAYVSHALIACLGVIAYLFINTVVEYYAFGFSTLLAADILLHALLGLLVFVVLYGHLRFTTLFAPRRIGLIALTVAISIVGLSSFTTYVQSLEYSDSLPYPPELKPPQFQIKQAKTLTEFMRSAEKIPTQLAPAN